MLNEIMAEKEAERCETCHSSTELISKVSVVINQSGFSNITDFEDRLTDLLRKLHHEKHWVHRIQGGKRLEGCYHGIGTCRKELQAILERERNANHSEEEGHGAVKKNLMNQVISEIFENGREDNGNCGEVSEALDTSQREHDFSNTSASDEDNDPKFNGHESETSRNFQTRHNDKYDNKIEQNNLIEINANETGNDIENMTFKTTEDPNDSLHGSELDQENGNYENNSSISKHQNEESRPKSTKRVVYERADNMNSISTEQNEEDRRETKTRLDKKENYDAQTNSNKEEEVEEIEKEGKHTSNKFKMYNPVEQIKQDNGEDNAVGTTAEKNTNVKQNTGGEQQDEQRPTTELERELGSSLPHGSSVEENIHSAASVRAIKDSVEKERENFATRSKDENEESLKVDKTTEDRRELESSSLQGTCRDKNMQKPDAGEDSKDSLEEKGEKFGSRIKDAASLSLDVARKDKSSPKAERKLLHHFSIDKDVYKYILVHCNREFEEIKELCDTIKERREGLNVSLDFTAKHGIDENLVKNRFQMLSDQVKVDEYTAPNGVNLTVLDSIVRTSEKSSKITTVSQEEKNSIKIVGQPDEVDTLKKHIAATVKEQVKSAGQLQRPKCSSSDYETGHSEWQDGRYAAQSSKTYQHSIPMDKHKYMYIVFHHNDDIQRVVKLCTSKTSSEEGSTSIISLQVKQEKDIKTIDRIFSNLIDRLWVEMCRMPRTIDFGNFALFVKEANTSKDVMIVQEEEQNSLKLIGPRHSVQKTKNWIEELLKHNIKESADKKTFPSKSDNNVPRGNYGDKAKDEYDKQSAAVGGSEGRRAFRITSCATDSLVFESKRVKNQLKIRIHQGNITQQKTDVLVSFTDKQLENYSAIARAILNAAGPSVQKECDKIKQDLRFLIEGQMVHTQAGRLGPSVRNLLHVITPKLIGYMGKKSAFANILHKTFVNCLEYTSEKLPYASTISIPPIGSSNFDEKLIAKAFFEAVEEFDGIAESTSCRFNLRSIHFVDKDPKVVQKIITAIKTFIEGT